MMAIILAKGLVTIISPKPIIVTTAKLNQIASKKLLTLESTSHIISAEIRKKTKKAG